MKRAVVAAVGAVGIAGLAVLPMALPRVTESPGSNQPAQLASATTDTCPQMDLCAARDRCLPPQVFRNACAPVPFDAQVRFGSEVRTANVAAGEIYWEWLKDGEPSKPCSVQQRTAYAVFATNPCDARIGEPLYRTRRFK